jgi:lysophospholipase L1-like esterase
MKITKQIKQMKLTGILLFCPFAITSLFGEPVPQFQSRDRWCAVGDSITHVGLYSRYIYLFYATRFPDREIDYFNGGIAGDTARGTLKRVESDILRHKPTVATIMLGMNDVVRGLYAERNAKVPDIQKKRDAAIDENAASMKKLGQTLKAAGTRIIFITP